MTGLIDQSKELKKRIDFDLILDSKRHNLNFYRQFSKKIVFFLANNGPTTFSDIIAYFGGGERRIIRLLDQMVEKGYIKYSNGKFLTIEANKVVNVTAVRCSTCDSKLVNTSQLKKVTKFMRTVVKNRPKATFDYDQRPVNLATIVRRVGYLILRSDIQNKKIAVIGDDDLTSIAIAITKMAKEVVVFDIDQRILDYINLISRKNDLKIKTVKLNLLNKMPLVYQNYFDTFITDPTPNPKPLALFTQRGLQMLKKNDQNAGYISLYPSHMEISVDFQKTLSRMNLLITDLIPFFNQYEIIEHTLTKNDKKLFVKYDVNESISFYEYFMRVVATKKSREIKLNVRSEDLIGKAAKQVASNK